ncbi:MAG: FAD-dependent oxidoreductase [Paenibacillaceae bacterium]
MYDIAIIGAGPTGASAALFAAKSGKKTLMFDSNQSITKKAWLENHYGVLEISGPDLVEIGKKQAEKFGTTIVEAAVKNIVPTETGFVISTEDNQYESQHVIIATGIFTELAEVIGLDTKPGTEPRIKTIVAVDNTGKTSIPGIWAAGTIAGASVHTIITAGDGAKVAINIISELNGERYVDHDMKK